MAARALRKQRQLTGRLEVDEVAAADKEVISSEESLSPQEDDSLTVRSAGASLFHLLNPSASDAEKSVSSESDVDSDTQKKVAKSVSKKKKNAGNQGGKKGQASKSSVAPPKKKQKHASGAKNADSKKHQEGTAALSSDSDDILDGLTNQVGTLHHMDSSAPSSNLQWFPCMSIEPRSLYPEKELRAKFGADFRLLSSTEEEAERLPSAVRYGTSVGETMAMRRILNDAHSSDRHKGFPVKKPTFVRIDMSWPRMFTAPYKLQPLLQSERNYDPEPKDVWAVRMARSLKRDILLREVFFRSTFATINPIVLYQFTPTADMLIANEEFQAAVESGDPDALFGFLHHHPYHFEALVRVAEFLATVGREPAEAQPFIDRALYTFEAAGRASSFDPMKRPLQLLLPYDCAPLNRPVHILFARHAQSLVKRACLRTALEIAKFLFSLDPSDPTYVLLSIDYLACACSEFGFVLEFGDMLNRILRPFAYLPNWWYSKAFATFMLAGKSEEEKRTAICDAVFTYPCVLARFLAASPNLSVTAGVPRHRIEELQQSELLARGVSCERPLVERLLVSCESRLFELWRQHPEFLRLLLEEAHHCSLSYASNDVAIDGFVTRRKDMDSDTMGWTALFLRYGLVNPSTVTTFFEPVPDNMSVLNVLSRGEGGLQLFAPTAASSSTSEVRDESNDDEMMAEWLEQSLSMSDPSSRNASASVTDRIRHGVDMARAFVWSLFPWNRVTEDMAMAMHLVHDFQAQQVRGLYDGV